MKFAFADFEFDMERYELRRAGKLVKGDATVVRLLAALLSKAPQLVSKEELVELVWDGRAIAENVLAVTIARLRRLLEHRRDHHEFITTAYGQGYRFSHPFERHEEKAADAGALPGAGDDALCLVGRDRQLALLFSGLRRAAVGRGRLCTLLGEPGIGKTYLVEAFERRLSRGEAQVAWGFCREAGDTPPLGPWLRLVREIRATADRLGWPLASDPVVAELTHMIRALDRRNLDAPLPNVIQHMALEGPRRHRLFEVLSRFLASAADHAPWLLVLENLHQADEASLEFLHHVLDEVMRTRIFIVATLRSVDAQGVPLRLSQVLGHSNAERIVLERLGEAEVAAYVRAATDDPSGSVTRAVFAKSEGNPFFMAEFTRQHITYGQAGLDAMKLPAAALDLVRQQLAKLEPETYRVLSAAAVMGRSFDLPLLRVVTELDARALMACVDEAIAAGVVIAAPDTKTGFAFGHELLRGALYDALARSDRRKLHFRVAEALEARSEAGDAVAPSELAHHFHAALPETDLCKTVRFCRKAAGAAALASANADVIRYMHYALEALEMREQPSHRLRMHLLYVISMFARGHVMGEFQRAMSELIALAREHDDAKMLVRGGVLLNLHPSLKPVPGAAAVMQRALELLPREAHSLRASALAGLATSAPACFTEDAYALIDQAADEARSSSAPFARYFALLGALTLYGGPRHALRAAALSNELDGLARQNQSMPFLSIDVSFHRLVTALQRGDRTSADVAIERAALRARQAQHPELQWHAARFRALSRANEGHAEQARAELTALHRSAEQEGLFGTTLFCAFDRIVVLGELSGVTGETAAVLHEYDASEPPCIWALKLRTLAAAGLMDEARAMLHAVSPAALARLPCDTHYLGTLGHVTRAALRLGELTYAEAAFALLEPFTAHFSVQVSLYCEGAVPQLLGMIAHALGRTPEAIAHFERAITMNDAAGFVLRSIEARLSLARLLAARGGVGDQKRVRSLRRQAQDAAARAGLSRLSEKASPSPFALPVALAADTR